MLEVIIVSLKEDHAVKSAKMTEKLQEHYHEMLEKATKIKELENSLALLKQEQEEKCNAIVIHYRRQMIEMEKKLETAEQVCTLKDERLNCANETTNAKCRKISQLQDELQNSEVEYEKKIEQQQQYFMQRIQELEAEKIDTEKCANAQQDNEHTWKTVNPRRSKDPEAETKSVNMQIKMPRNHIDIEPKQESVQRTHEVKNQPSKTNTPAKYMKYQALESQSENVKREQQVTIKKKMAVDDKNNDEKLRTNKEEKVQEPKALKTKTKMTPNTKDIEDNKRVISHKHQKTRYDEEEGNENVRYYSFEHLKLKRCR